MAVFVWTFQGVVLAIWLAVLLVGCVVVGLMLGWCRFLEWKDRRKRG